MLENVEVPELSTAKPVKIYLGIKAVIRRLNPAMGGREEFLLLKSVSKAIPGGWRRDLPGGRINAGEYSVAEVLRRELSEELNLSELELDELELGKCLGLQIMERPSLDAGLALCFYEIAAGEKLAEKNFELSDEHLAWEWWPWSGLGALKESDGGETDWAVFLKGLYVR